MHDILSNDEALDNGLNDGHQRTVKTQKIESEKDIPPANEHV